MTRRTANKINAQALRRQWLGEAPSLRAAIREQFPRSANKMDGVITVCPAGVAVVPEWMQ
jgi:hypothetical protein